MNKIERRQRAVDSAARLGGIGWKAVCASAALLLGTTCFSVGAQEPKVLSGGVGTDERFEVQARRSDYNLRLAFADARGRYLSDVAVHIDADRDGEYKPIYDAKGVGPLFYAQLAPGRYRINLAYHNVSRSLERQVGTEQKLPEIVVHWPAEE